MVNHGKCNDLNFSQNVICYVYTLSIFWEDGGEKDVDQEIFFERNEY